MIEIVGKHNTAVCYTNELEPTAYAQIQSVCNELCRMYTPERAAPLERP